MDHKFIVLLITMFVLSFAHQHHVYEQAGGFTALNGRNMTGEPSSSMLDKRDLEALLSFKRCIISDPQGSLSDWTAHNSHNVCRWNGISCTPNTKRVVSIYLRDCSLNGTLSPYIGNLSLLRTLDLLGNDFSGRIPPSIGNLSLLRTLVLSWNHFSGRIPPSIGNLSLLRTLDLSRNHFSGRIPPSIGNLSLLRTLDLSINNLIGQILASIGILSGLRLLNLSGNQLEGPIPASLSNISTLEELDLSKNNLSGQIPEALSKLHSLAVLDVSSNNLCGPIPRGTQFSTFSATSFQKNKCLYGCPLDSCNGKENPGREDHNNSSSTHIKVGWLDRLDDKMSLMALGIGFGIGIWGVVGVFIFCKRAKLWVLGLPPNIPRLFYGLYRFPK